MHSVGSKRHKLTIGIITGGNSSGKGHGNKGGAGGSHGGNSFGHG